MSPMNDKEMAAYKWALNQVHQSVSAQHARTLAQYIERSKAADEKAERSLCEALNTGDGRYIP